jgi:amidase
VRAVFDKAVEEVRTLGAQVVDPITIPNLIDRLDQAFDANVFETEAALNKYLAEHRAPFRTLREILLSGRMVPSRALTLISAVGKSTDDIGYLQVLRAQEEIRQLVLALMADQKLDAIMYTTFDHQPGIIADEVMTRAVVDDFAGIGNNRRLSPAIGFPALAVAAGFTTDGIPVGIEFMARPYEEPTLLKLAFAYEQGTRHRQPPALTSARRSQ